MALSAVLILLVPLSSRAVASPLVSTDFPGIVVQPGQVVDFPLTLTETGGGGEIVSLTVASVPDGWQAIFKGNSQEVTEAYVRSGNPVSVDLQVKMPADVKPGTYRVDVDASGPGGTSSLPLQVKVGGTQAAKP